MAPHLKQRRLSPRDQGLLFAVCCLLLITAFVFGVYRPSIAELRSLHSQNDVSRQTLNMLEEAQRQHATVVLDHKKALDRAVLTLSQLPRESDLPAIMAAVDHIAKSRGAKTEVIDYAQPVWEKSEGRVQVTALFTGEYSALAATTVDLQRVLPSVHLEQARITAQASPASPTTEPTATSATESPNAVAATLRKVLGLTSVVPEPVVTQADANVSPLQVDHLEAQLVFTIYLVGAPTASSPDEKDKDQAPSGEQLVELEKIVGSKGQWYARQVSPWRGVAGDPFRPSERAAELVRLAQLVEQYKTVRVTGIANSGNQWTALVEFMGQPYRLKTGDKVGEAKVSRIDSKGVTLNIAGRSILINLGGAQG